MQWSQDGLQIASYAKTTWSKIVKANSPNVLQIFLKDIANKEAVQ